MSFSDPYEEWKQAGRPGGTYKPPAAPAPAATTPPAPAPPPPMPAGAQPARPAGQAPAPAPGGHLAGVGGSDAAVNEANAAYNAGQRGSDPTKIFQPGQLDAMRAGAAGSSEDYARYSPETMAGWEQYRQPGTMKYKSMRGAPGLFDKPTECPPGQGPSGPNETDPCTTQGYSSGGGGGQGGQAPGGVGGGAGAGMAGFDDMQNWWMNKIKDQGTRYSPEAMAALEADQFSRARAQEKGQLEMARQDQAQRGVSRSGNQNAAIRQIGVGTGQQIMQNRAQIQRAKIDADFQDKQAAIKNAQDYVNSMRDYLLRSDSNAIQREQIAAQIRLATQNINAQKDMLEQQYQNNLSSNFLLGNAG